MFNSLSTSLIARGILAVVIGIIALAWPSVTVLALVILFAVYAFIAAGLQAARAFGSRTAGPVIGHLLLGLADLAAGVIALAWPGPTALVLVLIVGTWAIIAGLVEFSAAFASGEPAGTPRPDALIPALDDGQLAALREIGREWDQVSADRQVWRQALPVDPSLGEYPEASEVRPGLFTRSCPSRDETGNCRRSKPRASPRRTHAAGPGRPGTQTAGLRLTAGRHRDRGGADAQARGAPRAVGGRAVLGRLRAPGDAGRPGLGRPARLVVLAARRRADRVPDAGGRDLLPPDDSGLPARRGSYIVASEELGRVRAVVAPLANYLWTLHEQRPDLTLTLAVPDLVDRHWWHRIRHEHVAERLQPVLQSLPRVVVTSVPFHQAD